MKRLPRYLFDRIPPLARRCITFAAPSRYPSDITIATAANGAASTAAPTEIGGASNAMVAHTGDDGYVLLCKYGKHFHEAGIQIFDRAAANAIVERFGSAWAKVKRALVAGSANVPAYYWHPDEPAFAANGTSEDTTIYGNFTDLQARDDGLYGKPEYTAAGNALLNAGSKLWFSPRWVMKRISLHGIEPKQWSPMKLMSVGIVEQPNIYGAAANAAPTTNPLNHTMLKEILIALGYTEDQIAAMENGAEGALTSAAVIAKITELQTAATSEADDSAELDAAIAAKTEAEQQLSAANAALQSARRAAATVFVDSQVAACRIAPSAKATEIEKLATAPDFAAAANALATRKPILPSGSHSTNLGARKGEVAAAANAASDFESRVTEMTAQNGGDRDRAWQEAKTKHAELFARMSQTAL